jgi:hypothetical protein
VKFDRFALMVGSVLLLLLGLARGSGGVILLLHGHAADARILASEPVVSRLAVGLVVIGLLVIVSAIGIMRGKAGFWFLGVIGTILFVIDGAINGYFLYGSPGEAGTAVNVVASLIILAALFRGRKILTSVDQWRNPTGRSPIRSRE